MRAWPWPERILTILAGLAVIAAVLGAIGVIQL